MMDGQHLCDDDCDSLQALSQPRDAAKPVPALNGILRQRPR